MLITAGPTREKIDPVRYKEYRNADNGYNSRYGSKDQYKLAYRDGFEAGYATTWNWDAGSSTWKRSIFGGPERAASGVQLAPQNVVVMFVQYAGGAGVEGAEAELTGTGPAWVFTGGDVVKGTWSRPDKAKPAALLDANGRVVALAPGQTWVELPQAGYPVTVTPAP